MTFGGRRSAITTMIYLKFDDNVFVVLNKLLWFQFVWLHLLLTMKDSAMDVPTNLDARRRITFFANSLFMKMPRAPRVHDMISFRCVYISSMSFYFSSIVRPNFSGFCKKKIQKWKYWNICVLLWSISGLPTSSQELKLLGSSGWCMKPNMVSKPEVSSSSLGRGIF